MADSWYSDSKLMRYVATTHPGTMLVEGKGTYAFALQDGLQIQVEDIQHQLDWPWPHSQQAPGVHYARLQATSPILRRVC